ncbi:MAG TPA: hypothetical protein PLU07_10495 [Ferruginibacter sp.]|jgi:hypothetical protein|nr:hypothetical protein [Ferruginibacter sp.]
MQTIKNDEILNYNKPQNELTAQVAYSYSAGTGYTSAPTVAFSGGGGSNAAGTAVVVKGRVVSVTITNGGSGYTTAPTVAFTGGGSTGAAATAVVTDGVVTAINITNSGNDRKLTITDSTSYTSPDSRAKVHVEVYDKAGNKGVGNIGTSPANVVLDVVGLGLDPSEGISASVTVVSADGKIKDGSAHGIGVINNAGWFKMEA